MTRRSTRRKQRYPDLHQVLTGISLSMARKSWLAIWHQVNLFQTVTRILFQALQAHGAVNFRIPWMKVESIQHRLAPVRHGIKQGSMLVLIRRVQAVKVTVQL